MRHIINGIDVLWKMRSLRQSCPAVLDDSSTANGTNRIH
jgi:hypothetical protein